ncbi:expressed unknown protein [Seminavis robusta]|uniref:Uncharacterized protein n=1 Tax=Seminavis robusta TaxID=568900 RepID=A0A9N8HMQ6_9STRA|nr:expressed unknown protein [Seminavis robusta]|eukprot:Sro1141_g245640.1 n/a (1012) ;mRNA; f:15278-18767
MPNIITTEEQRGTAIATSLNILHYFKQNTEVVWEILKLTSEMLKKESACTTHEDQPPPLSTTTTTINVTNLQAGHCLQGLIHSRCCIHRDMEEKYHECCMRILICLAPQLPAEDTAHGMVGHILLPYLESNLHTLSCLESPVEDNSMRVELSFQAIQSLLQVKKHASALLAPLVKDVAPNGQETYQINPLRKRLFHVFQTAIQNYLSCPQPNVVTTTTSQLATIYSGLAMALEVATAVDKSSSVPSSSSSMFKQGTGVASENTIRDLDVLVMERFFKEVFQNEDLMTASYSNTPNEIWIVLLSYLKHQPDASLSLGSTLLLRGNGMRAVEWKGTNDSNAAGTKCSRCGYDCDKLPSFLRLVHGIRNGVERDLLLASLAIMATQAPWKLWLGKKYPQHSRQYQGGAVSNFSVRVLEALMGILVVTTCILKVHCDDWESRAHNIDCAGFLSLFKATLLEIPYESLSNSSAEGQRVVEAAQELFAAFSNILVQENKLQSAPLDRLTAIFEDCMGGHITPQGLRTEMILPARNMLASSSSRFLLDSMFGAINKTVATDTGKAAEAPVRLLRSVLRTRPETVLDDESDWTRYRCVVEKLCVSSNTKLMSSGMELLDSLLQGRQHDMPAKEVFVAAETLVTFVLKLLPETIESVSGTCRRLSLQAYGSLLGSDWLEHTDDRCVGSIGSHVKIVLRHSVATEAVSAVRSAACKAIGDICSNCFLCQNFPDSSGVDAASSSEDSQLQLIGPDVLGAMLIAMKDRSAPVRSMALFAVGNLAQVSVDSACFYDPETLGDACEVACACMGDENEKVAGNAIRSIGHLASLIVRDDYSRAMSQRGWGVDAFCTTVNALGSVVRCIQSLGTSLDEKVVIAAMSCLQTLSPTSLARISAKSELVGNAMVASICYLAKESWSKGTYSSTKKLVGQVELLCRHLLDTATTVDASVVTGCEEIAESWMEHLYEWMILQECTVGAFDVFALALQRPGSRVPINVEQKFANRAMTLFRAQDDAADSDDEL